MVETINAVNFLYAIGGAGLIVLVAILATHERWSIFNYEDSIKSYQDPRAKIMIKKMEAKRAKEKSERANLQRNSPLLARVLSLF